MKSHYAIESLEGKRTVVHDTSPLGRPGFDYIWHERTQAWVQDQYAMLLAALHMRQQRNTLLLDALNVLDRHGHQSRFHVATTLSEVEVRDVAHYAQALRDVPQQSGFPWEIVWPLKPPVLDRSPSL